MVWYGTQLLTSSQENDSYFHEAIQHWRELNLSREFLTFARRVDGLSASMPLLVHHWRQILELWLEAVDKADEEAFKPLLEYVTRYEFQFSCSTAMPQLISESLA